MAGRLWPWFNGGHSFGTLTCLKCALIEVMAMLNLWRMVKEYEEKEGEGREDRNREQGLELKNSERPGLAPSS